MKKKLDSALVASIVLFVVTVCIFGPLEIYVANQAELWFGLLDVLMVCGMMSAAATVILGGTGMMLKEKWRHAYTAVLFCVSICLYLQGNYLNISYGTLDGQAVRWDNYDTYAVMNTATWVAVFIVCVVLWKKKRELFQKIQVYASAFIAAMQVLTLGILLITSGVFSGQENDVGYLSTENLHVIGKENNIVVFVLDAFDEAYVEELFETEPEKYKEIFGDFTHYTNMAAGGAATNGAMPIIVTGEKYPGNVSYREYIEGAFDADKLYTTLKKNGYSVNIYTDSEFVPAGADEFVDNLVNGKYKIASPLGFAQKYTSLTLYKYMPHLLKRYFWLYTGDFDAHKKGSESGYAAYQADDAEFYRVLAEEGLQMMNEKTFTILHTTGAHPPYNLNEFAQRQEDVTILQKCRGQLYIVEEYLRQMKKLGVYDSSTVILTSDHGQQNMVRSIMLIKRPNAKGFEEKDTPVSHFDLHNTFFELMGVEKGESIFDIAEDAERTRMYYLQSSSKGSFAITEYMIQGNPKNAENIVATGSVLEPEMKKRRYEFGEELTFGANGTINNYVESGLSSVPVGYSWTNGYDTVFRILLEKKPRKDLQLDLKYYMAYVELGDQYLGIYADDQLLFEEVLTKSDSRTITVSVPKELCKDRELVIRLAMPDAKIPAEVLGPGNDARRLGLALTGMCIQ